MLPAWLTPQIILIAVVFVVVLFMLYKLFRLVTRLAVAAIAGFSFPWVIAAVAGYLGVQLPFSIAADIGTGLMFAATGAGLVLLYEFAHFILYFFKIITWPLRMLFRRRK